MKKKLTVAGIALTLILLIPMLYSTIFIKSMMDPYGNIDKLPVALVENQSTNRVYTALKESNVFDFTLTNHEKAVEKLKQGKVYAIIEFESDFMNKLSEFPAKQAPAEIKLTTGEGLNYSSAKIISSAVDKFVLKANNQTASSMVEKLNQEKVPIPANISEVIQLKHEEYYPVKNNGEAMAPYILSLTLFVGSIFLNQFVMRIFKKKPTITAAIGVNNTCILY
ncbi:YhgE/Pip domain-containing protein [Enterococcus termitis]